MKRISFWVVLLILTCFITLFKLGDIPKAFYFDEAALGYYGWSLFKYGTDEFGNHLPFYFKSIGDYKYPVYSYLSIIPNALFGLNEFSARFLAALSGIVVIFITFWIAFKEKLLVNSLVLRISVLLLVLSSPWYLLFARTAREATLGLAFFMLAFWYIYRYFFQKVFKRSYLIAALIFILLSSLSYSVFRIFIPILFGGLF